MEQASHRRLARQSRNMPGMHTNKTTVKRMQCARGSVARH